MELFSIRIQRTFQLVSTTIPFVDMEGVSKCTPSFHIYSIQRNLIVSSGTVHIQLSLMIVLKQYHG